MRPVILLTVLLLTGCHRQYVKSVRVVADATGTNELVLYDTVRPWLLGNGEDHEFHSLVWKVKSGSNWTEKATISRDAFMAGKSRAAGLPFTSGRWVNDINSLNPNSGTAIIKVAEDSAPVTNGSTIAIACVYSWREWNLLTNGEVQLLRVCKDPFEKY